MDTPRLYTQFDQAEKFITRPEGHVVVDQSASATFGLDWASRQKEQATPVETAKLNPSMPIPN